MITETYDKLTGADAAHDGADPIGPACADLGEDAAAVGQPEQGGESDETTGASPGTAQACTDLGLSSLKTNLERFSIKPPGMA